MTSQKKDYDETEELQDTLSENTEPKPRNKGISKFIKPTLITVLSILCLSGGIVLHKMHSFKTEHKEIPVKTKLIKKTNSLSLLTQNPPTKTPNTLSLNPVPETISKISTSDTTINTFTPQKPDNVSLSEEPIKSLTQPNTTLSVAKMEGFTLNDALRFKEKFLTEDNCYEEYQQLSNAIHKTSTANVVLENLYPYCISNTGAVKNVKEAFLKNKKAALIVYYRENNPLWLAYLKAIPAMLIEIRKINPLKDTPKDILYRAQNELYSQNVSKAMDLINSLPLSMQRKMSDFFREAGIYNSAKESLNQLILSFEKKGE